MKLKFFKFEIHSFWMYQIFGWSIFFLASFLHTFNSPLSTYNKIMREFIEAVSGLFLTSILRYYYIRLEIQFLTIYKLIGRITVASIILSFIWFYLIALLRPIFFQSSLLRVSTDISTIISWLTILFPIIFSWSALYIGIKFWLEWGLQKNKVDQANTIATETRLQMLRYQLNPHFLFNALNSIRATIGDNDNKARSMITELSEFLRYSLLSNDHQEIPFKDEITTVKHYLSIEKKRFEEKLDIKFEIDPNVENFPILSFLIHPIIENAIKYGMKTSKIPLKILIKADELKNGLCINIINSGYWIKPTQKDRDSAQGTGTGLENVTARLKWGFPDRHKFEYFERDGNVVVIMELYKNLETSS